MKNGCRYLLLALINLPLAPLSALTLLLALQAPAPHSPLWWYTLISGVLMFVLPLLISLSLCC